MYVEYSLHPMIIIANDERRLFHHMLYVEIYRLHFQHWRAVEDYQG